MIYSAEYQGQILYFLQLTSSLIVSCSFPSQTKTKLVQSQIYLRISHKIDAMVNITFYLGNVGESIFVLNVIVSGVIWILLDIKTHKCSYMCACVIVHFRGHADSPFQKSPFHTPLVVTMSSWSLLFL